MSKKRGKRANRTTEEFAEELQRPRKPIVAVHLEPQTPGQERYIEEIATHDITFCLGPAGCGKTVIAVGLALQKILSPKPQYEKLIIMRPAKEACGESIGFLPGDMAEKMQPWAAPLVDNMKVFVDDKVIKDMFFEGKIEVVPLAFARGRSFNGSFIILDEAQNCTPQQILMVLTRIGAGSKMVINGDPLQSDIPGPSGLEDAVRRLEGMAGAGVARMGEEDIRRHPLIGEILRRYAQ